MKMNSRKFAAGALTAAILLIASASDSSAKKKKNEKAESKSQAAIKEGETSFKKNCDMCHFSDKTDKKIGPGLKDLFKNKELPESHKPVTEANVREQIEAGSPDAKPMPMPGFKDKLSPAEIDSLIEYLKTL